MPLLFDKKQEKESYSGNKNVLLDL